MYDGAPVYRSQVVLITDKIKWYINHDSKIVEYKNNRNLNFHKVVGNKW